MRTHYTFFGLLAVFVVSPICVYADFDAEKWQFQKEINFNTGEAQSEYVTVNIDNETSFGANTNLSDIRIITREGKEVPYQLVIENDSVRNEYVATQLYNLSAEEDHVSFILDLGESATIHDRLVIQTKTKNFKHKVAVYVADEQISATDKSWRLLTDQGYIYNFHDSTTGFDAGHGEVLYPENTARYIKVVIHKGEGELIAVTGANVFQMLEKTRKEHERVLPLKSVENPKYKTTELTLDLGGEGLATHRIVLRVRETINFNRRAIVQGSNDGEYWSLLGEGYVFSLRTPLFSGTALALPYRETQQRYLRVIIENNDDQPIAWEDSVSVSGISRSVIFSAEKGVGYLLYYGNKNATSPRYDFSRYFKYIESTALTQGTLGGVLVNPVFEVPVLPQKPFTETKPGLLTGALVLLVSLVTFFLISYLKQLKMSSRGPRE